MSRRVIAVVDDEPAIRAYISVLLTMSGYAAEEYPDGRTFLDTHHPATSGVVINLCLPYPGGRETLVEIQERGMGLPILSISSTVNPGEEELRSLGVAHRLVMPFTPNEFFAVVAQVLGPPA